ncbi:MAG: transcriptional regulator [Arcicella sp.]|nr:transcriptional regulator [Arcicella sp.]
MNYIKHLTGFFDKVIQDRHLNPTHISLYIALFQQWNVNRFQNPISITRDEIMRISKIASKATYHKCMRELNEKGFLKYEPSFNPFKGSMVILFNFSEESKAVQKKESDLDKKELKNEQVLNKQQTSISTGTEQALVPSINYINNLNISKGANENEFTENFENENSDLKKENEPNRMQEVFAATDKNQIENWRQKSSVKKENPPTSQEVRTYFLENSLSELEAQKFFNYFCSNGWLVGGKTPMVDWQAAAQNWMLNVNKFISYGNQQKRAGNLSSSADKDYSEPL